MYLGNQRGNSGIVFMVGILVIVGTLLWGGLRVINSIQFTQGCKGHLKRAADANTVQLAKEELAIALNYIEAHELTSGYTSVLYRTPDEDVEFWYRNLSSALAELSAMKPDATMLEKSNMLMKLRETLLDDGEKGTKVTRPRGISIYPNNVAYCFFGWLTAGLLCIALVGVAANDRY